MRVLRQALAAFVGGLVVLCSSFANADAQARSVTYNLGIPSQELNSALQQFALTSQHRLLYRTELVEGKTSEALKGQFTAAEALSKLLSGMNLLFEITPSAVVLIRAKEAPAQTQSASQTTSGGNAPDADAHESASRLHGVRIAQSQTPRSSLSEGDQTLAQNTSSNSDRDEITTPFSEVVVTGTHIRGVESAGSKVIVISRDYIDSSGYATVQDVLRTLPQNYGGGISEDFTTDQSAQNLNFGTTVNLRGLGGDSTLVLVNGRRQPGGGLNGAFIDISSIAVSAIERIEVLTDGASAIYGSDAVAGVVNIILRKDYQGAETRARFGTLSGNADEIQASQLFGTDWDSGNALIGYQYYKREALATVDRSYAASDDLTRFGGSDYRSVESNPGNILDPTTFQPAFAIPAGQDGTSLTTDDLLLDSVNFRESSEQADSLPEQESHSAFFTASERVGQGVELFVEGRYATRDTWRRNSGSHATIAVPASNPFFFGDPFGFGFPFVVVSYSFLDDLGPITGTSTTETIAGTVGTTLKLEQSWQTTLAVSYGEEKVRFENSNLLNFQMLNEALGFGDDPTTQFNPDINGYFNPFGEGSNSSAAVLEAIRGFQVNRARTRVWTSNIAADGPVFSLPGGLSRLAVGADYREEDLTTGLTSSFFTEGFGTDTGRHVSAAFAELALPLVNGDNALPAVRRLEASLAGRYEEYSDFGSSFDPKIGLRWSPIDSLTVHGTWGTSFKAPRLGDLPEDPAASPGNVIFLNSFTADPESEPFGFSPVLFIVGNNEDLKPETATTWTAGLDFSPSMAPQLTLSATYFDIDFEDRIAIGGPPEDPLAVLLQEDVWVDIITRNPSQSQINALCNDPRFTDLPASCAATPPVAIVDIRFRNLAEVRMQGLDFGAQYSADTGVGTLGLSLNGSYVLDFEQKVSSRAPTVDLVDTVLNIPALRLRGGATWSYGGFAANVLVNYTGSYDDTLSLTNTSVDSWTTIDLGLSYRTSIGRGRFDGVQFGLNVVNVFDKDPPFANVGFVGQAFGYDPANADPYGRLISAHISVSW